MEFVICTFYEQDNKVKKQYYSKRFVYLSNMDLHKAPVSDWRDTFYCSMSPVLPNPEDLPEACREIMVEYSKKVKELGRTLVGLLSEGLGLHPDHLINMDCEEGLSLICHYYPPCPEPQLTLGNCKHSDNDFITVLLHNHLGCLQILHADQWVFLPLLDPWW